MQPPQLTAWQRRAALRKPLALQVVRVGFRTQGTAAVLASCLCYGYTQGHSIWGRCRFDSTWSTKRGNGRRGNLFTSEPKTSALPVLGCGSIAAGSPCQIPMRTCAHDSACPAEDVTATCSLWLHASKLQQQQGASCACCAQQPCSMTSNIICGRAQPQAADLCAPEARARAQRHPLTGPASSQAGAAPLVSMPPPAALAAPAYPGRVEQLRGGPIVIHGLVAEM